jgi:hypothetical protein
MKGIAGEQLRVGDLLMRGADGKYYRAEGTAVLAGTPIEPIDKGDLMETEDGKWRPASPE